MKQAFEAEWKAYGERFFVAFIGNNGLAQLLKPKFDQAWREAGEAFKRDFFGPGPQLPAQAPANNQVRDPNAILEAFRLVDVVNSNRK